MKNLILLSSLFLSNLVFSQNGPGNPETSINNLITGSCNISEKSFTYNVNNVLGSMPINLTVEVKDVLAGTIAYEYNYNEIYKTIFKSMFYSNTTTSRAYSISVYGNFYTTDGNYNYDNYNILCRF